MDVAQEKLKLLTAAEVCAECDLEADVAEWLEAKPDAATFLRQLTDAGHHMDAAQFLCNALEPREAVWLAWDVGRLNATDDAPDKVKQAVAATHKWLTTLEDKDRRAAHDASEVCGLDKAAGSAAYAAFYAAGSIGPEDLAEPIPVPAGICAKMAAGAILFAAVEDPHNIDERVAASVAHWFTLAATEPPWGNPPVSDVASVRIVKADAAKGDAKAAAADAAPAAPGGEPPKPAAPKPDDSGYDDSGYNTDMKF